MDKLIFILIFVFISCSNDQTGHNSAAAVSASTPDGSALFRKHCVVCHGADGTLGLNGAKDLTQSALPLEERINIITNGKKLMTPFGTILSQDEIKAVAEYTLTLKK
jgi:mono/diheme cytochrome c family protein